MPSLLLNLDSYIASSSFDWSGSSTGQFSPGFALDSPPIFSDAVRNSKFIVVVRVYILSDETLDPSAITRNSGIGVLQFLVNPRPDVSDVRVTVTPAVGQSLSTYFSINCSGGLADNLPLKYSIGYMTGDKDITGARQELASVCQWLLIENPNCALTNYKLYLPVGSAHFDYTNVICIGVSDAVGSTMYYFSRSVTVYPAKTNATVRLYNLHSII